MAITLENVRKVRAVKPPRVVIYGPPGLGKTSLAAEFPAPIFIQVEDGTPSHLELESFGEISSFDDVMDAIEALRNGGHGYSTLVIDSIGALEPLIWDKTCSDRDKPCANIEAVGYGKGYVEALKYWRELISALNALRSEQSMAIVMIAHSEVVKSPNPTGEDFPAWDFSVNKLARAIVTRDVDCVLMINFAQSTQKDEGKKVKGSTAPNRWIYCEGNAALDAKNRYGLPDKILYREGEGFSSLAPYFSQNSKNGASHG